MKYDFNSNMKEWNRIDIQNHKKVLLSYIKYMLASGNIMKKKVGVYICIFFNICF